MFLSYRAKINCRSRRATVLRRDRGRLGTGYDGSEDFGVHARNETPEGETANALHAERIVRDKVPGRLNVGGADDHEGMVPLQPIPLPQAPGDHERAVFKFTR